MICIYSQNNNNYQANGDAVLEPLSCDLEITINGAWSLTLEHPYDPEEKYKYIVEGAVIRADIRCIRELTGVRQLFRVYDYKKGLHSVTAIAFPVAMEATYDAPIDNLVIQNKTGSQAMTALQAFTNKYTLATDITKVASSSFSNTNVNSAIANGSDNCFIKVWGGEILYDNLTFNVKNRLGDTEAGDHQITYGRNLTDITYTKDDSGLITRIYPISQDGIRLSGDHFVNSPKIYDYPIVHSHFIRAPYTLINTDASSPSQTAQQTRTSGAAVRASAAALAQSSYEAALALGFEPEYIKEIRQEIISAVTTMALENVISTSLYNYLSGIIADAMSFLSELEQPDWYWYGSWENGWKYGNGESYAVNKYVKIGKTWSYFGEDGNWQEPRDDSGNWDWYQAQDGTNRQYGNFEHYYAHNEYVYITMSGTLTKYYFDADGWYDDSKTEASTWDWHGSGTSSDPYWFGESGATSEESNKYAHDCWLFIDGSLYFFDHFGYYTPGNKFADYQWDWVETSDGFWFGNAEDKTYGAVYLDDQWAKINGTWIQFAGGAMTENQSLSLALYEFTNGMAGLKTVVNAQKDILYDLLDDQMIAYANSRFAAGVDVPAVTITVDMADLSKTTEYAGFENLETVKLGDAVICTDNEHNISMTSRVIGLTYDCIRDYNSTVVIGKAGASVSSIVGNANSEVVSGGFDTTVLEAQIAALQGKVGEIFMNDASIVSNGVGRFAIQEGSNISISRSGNTLTINSTGGDGDVNLYYGLEPPSNSIGDDKDLYALIKSNSYIPSDNHEGTHSRDYGAQKSWNNKWNFVVTGTKSYAFDSFILSGNINLTNGKRYKVRFSARMLSQDVTYTNNKAGDGFYKWYAVVIHNYFYNSYQSDYSDDTTAYDGDTAEKTGASHEFYLQSLVQDNEWHDYEYEFTAHRNGGHCIQIDTSGVNGDIELWIQNLELISVNDYGDEVESLYVKVGNEWLLKSDDKVTDILVDGESVVNEDGIANIEMSGQTYTAGTNVQISEQNVISATDTTYTAGSNVQISAQNVISATDTTYNVFEAPTSAQGAGTNGLVPAPTYAEVQAEKVLGANGNWVDQEGGVEIVILNSYADYEALTPAQMDDPTKEYLVKNIPTTDGLPFEIVNGKLCIVYDDGEE